MLIHSLEELSPDGIILSDSSGITEAEKTSLFEPQTGHFLGFLDSDPFEEV